MKLKNGMAFWTGTQFLEGYFWFCNSLAMWPWTSHPTCALTSSTKMKGWVQAPFSDCSFLWFTGFQYLPSFPHSCERSVIFRHQLSLYNNNISHSTGICHLQITFISTITSSYNFYPPPSSSSSFSHTVSPRIGEDFFIWQVGLSAPPRDGLIIPCYLGGPDMITRFLVRGQRKAGELESGKVTWG